VRCGSGVAASAPRCGNRTREAEQDGRTRFGYHVNLGVAGVSVFRRTEIKTSGDIRRQRFLPVRYDGSRWGGGLVTSVKPKAFGKKLARIDTADRHSEVAPEVGFEPTTNRLTADRSTTELLRNFPVAGGVYGAAVLHGQLVFRPSKRGTCCEKRGSWQAISSAALDRRSPHR
jgi:hypothetical protein